MTRFKITDNAWHEATTDGYLYLINVGSVGNVMYDVTSGFDVSISSYGANNNYAYNGIFVKKGCVIGLQKV